MSLWAARAFEWRVQPEPAGWVWVKCAFGDLISLWFDLPAYFKAEPFTLCAFRGLPSPIPHGCFQENSELPTCDLLPACAQFCSRDTNSWHSAGTNSRSSWFLGYSPRTEAEWCLVDFRARLDEVSSQGPKGQGPSGRTCQSLAMAEAVSPSPKLFGLVVWRLPSA